MMSGRMAMIITSGGGGEEEEEVTQGESLRE